MAWYVAASLNKLLAEVNAKFPNRDKTSDGSVGDTSHAARPSDHNPSQSSRPPGCVRARDFDADIRDPRWPNVHAWLRATNWLNRDRRWKYIISNGKIISYYPVGGYPAWAERPYGGSNPHKQHFHGSIRAGDEFEDDTSSWLTSGGDWFSMATKAELIEILDARIEPVESRLNDVQVRVVGMEKSLGRPYPGRGSVQKALIKSVTDPETGETVYAEHLDIIQSMLSELINRQAEMEDRLTAIEAKLNE